jgi:phospholipid-binding lipoprotein MlaA
MAFVAALIAYCGSARAMTDLLEPINRAMFRFNDAVLDHVVTPAGDLAAKWLSPDVRNAARNMYANLSESEFIATNLLQGNFSAAGISLERMAINTTVGVVGVYDRATEFGITTSQPEFSEAVCSLGVPAGPYLVVPLVGPANVNSTIVLAGFWVADMYVLGLISSTLVAADIVLDTSVTAALLRHSVDPIDAKSTDPYEVQRREYFEYIEHSCIGNQAVRPVG